MEKKPARNPSAFSKLGQIYVWLTILVVVVIASLVYYFYQLKPGSPQKELLPSPAATEKSLVRIGWVEVVGVFPATAPEAFSIAFNANIFEGLTVFRNGKVAPGLAISWSNPDKNTWRFKLRNGVTFHNGNKFVAEDVKYSIEQALASAKQPPEKQWPNVYQVANIESVIVLDPSTVEIKTKEPDPVLLPKLASVFIISKKQAEKEGFDKLVGTGPYKLKSFEKGSYTLEANQNYWGGMPKVKTAVYKPVPFDKMTEALLNGELDIASLISSADNKKLQQRGFSVKAFDLPVVFQLSFDLANNKTPYVDTPKNPFKDKKVRQVLLYGINIDEFIKNAVPDSEPASQFVTSGIFGFDPKITRPAYDLEKAKELLAEAGYPNGFSVTVDVPLTYQTDKEIVRQLNRLGIKAKARVLHEDEFMRRVTSGDFSLIANAWAAETLDLGDLLDGTLHTKTQIKGQANTAGYSNPEVDNLIDEASKTFDSKKRLDLLQKATKTALDDVVQIPLYMGKNFAAVRRGFDWTPHNFGLVYAYEIAGR